MRYREGETAIAEQVALGVAIGNHPNHRIISIGDYYRVSRFRGIGYPVILSIGDPGPRAIFIFHAVEKKRHSSPMRSDARTIEPPIMIPVRPNPPKMI